MNKARRKSIDEIIAKFEEAKAILLDLQSDIEMVRDDEQEAFDNLPCSIQESERGEVMETAIENLEEAISQIEDTCMDALDEAIENLEEAKGE